MLGFLKRTRSLAKIPEEVQSLSKTSKSINSFRVAHSAMRLVFIGALGNKGIYDREELNRRYCHLFILHMVFVPYMGLS